VAGRPKAVPGGGPRSHHETDHRSLLGAAPARALKGDGEPGLAELHDAAFMKRVILAVALGTALSSAAFALSVGEKTGVNSARYHDDDRRLH
jgi:hypothetical protein